MTIRTENVLLGFAVAVIICVLIVLVGAVYHGSQYACVNWIAPAIVGDDTVARTLYCRLSGR